MHRAFDWRRLVSRLALTVSLLLRLAVSLTPEPPPAIPAFCLVRSRPSCRPHIRRDRTATHTRLLDHQLLSFLLPADPDHYRSLDLPFPPSHAGALRELTTCTHTPYRHRACLPAASLYAARLSRPRSIPPSLLSHCMTTNFHPVLRSASMLLNTIETSIPSPNCSD